MIPTSYVEGKGMKHLSADKLLEIGEKALPGGIWTTYEYPYKPSGAIRLLNDVWNPAC